MSAPLARSLDGPGPATSRAPPRHALRRPSPPIPTPVHTRDPRDRALAVATGRRPAETLPSGTYPHGTRNGQTPRACGPASQSHADSRCDASTGHAAAPSFAPTNPRTTPQSSRRQCVLPPAPRVAAPAPSRYSSLPGSCSPGSHARAAVPASPADTPATAAAAPAPGPTSRHAPHSAAPPTHAGISRTPPGWQNPGCHATATPAPTPP